MQLRSLCSFIPADSMIAEQIAQPETDPVLLDVADGVATLTLNRPRVHNAMNDELRAALGARFAQVRERDDVRVVLLRGAGRSFCSGRDTTRFVDPAHGSSHAEMIITAQQIRRAQLGCGKPMICALRGHAIGAGAELALGADFRVGAHDMKFSLPEAAYGLVADTGSSTLLTALVGPARAKWILLSAAVVDGDQALQWGLVEWLVAPDELDAFALKLATTLASRPPNAARLQKRLVDIQFEQQIDAGLGREMLAQLDIFASEEYAEVAAARDKARSK